MMGLWKYDDSKFIEIADKMIADDLEEIDRIVMKMIEDESLSVQVQHVLFIKLIKMVTGLYHRAMRAEERLARLESMEKSTSNSSDQ